MLHFYDECPCSLQEQEQRLEAARSLSDSGIRCIVHLEDALAFMFIHFVPTALFALNLGVADQDVDRASHIITGALPFAVHTGVIEQYRESILLDPAQTRVYTTSTHLWRSVPAVMDELWFIPNRASISMLGTIRAPSLSPRSLIQSASPLWSRFSIR